MQAIDKNSLGLYHGFLEKKEEAKNFLLRKVKVIVSPLSFSLPIAYVLSIASKSLKVANYFRSDVFLPGLVKSLEGTTSIIGAGAFINSTIGFIPWLTDSNLDEDVLKVSIHEILEKNKVNSPEIWSKRVVKQVKISLQKGCTKNGVKEEVAEMLIRKKTAMSEAAVRTFAKEIKLESKSKHVLEKISTFFFYVSSTNSVLRTCEKWDLISLSEISQRMGSSRLATSITQVTSKLPNCFGILTVGNLVRFSGLSGMSVKIVYDSYKLYQAQKGVSESADKSTEQARFLKERISKIWSVALGGLIILGIVAPLILIINPVILLTYEIAVGVLGLVNALR